MNRRRINLIEEIVHRGSFSYVELLRYYNKSKRTRILNWIGLLAVDLISATVLEYLRLSDIAKFDSAILNHIGRKLWLRVLDTGKFMLTSLQDLNLVRTVVDWIILKKLHFQELKVNINDLSYNVDILNRIMYNLVEQCYDMKSIVIEEYPNGLKVHNKSIHYLAALCSKLERISTCYLIIENEDLVALGKNCHNLKHINFQLPYGKPIPCVGILELLKNCRQLVHLELSMGRQNTELGMGEQFFSSTILSSLGTYCGLIESVNLEDFSDANGDDIEIFAKGCPRLKSILFHSVKTHEVFVKYFQALSKHCRLLESIYIKISEELADTDDERILAAVQSNLPLLREFSIYGFVTDKCVQILIHNCPLLERPNFGMSVSSFRELRHFKNLTHLHLCHGLLSWEDVEELLKTNGHTLEHISLDRFASDSSLRCLGDNCPQLTTIEGYPNDNAVTSLGMIYIFKKCKLLSRFNFGFDGFKIMPSELFEEFYERLKSIPAEKSNTFLEESKPYTVSRKPTVTENQNVPLKDKKLFTIINNLVQVDNMAECDFINDCNKAQRILNLNWIGLLTNDWFCSVFLQYLNFFEIGKIDTAICNLVGRREWLHVLEKSFVSAPIDDVKWSKRVIDWILLKKMHFQVLNINVCEWSKDLILSSERVLNLAMQCPDLKKIAITDARSNCDRKDYHINAYYQINDPTKYNELIITEEILLSLFAICRKIESILLHYIPLNFRKLARLGLILRQLKTINIQLPSDTEVNDSTMPICDIFKHTPNLTSVEFNTSDDNLYSSLLSALSESCPLLESVALSFLSHDDENSDEHIEKFLKGCPKLKSIRICSVWTSVIFVKYLQMLGTHSHLVEEVNLSSNHFSNDFNNDVHAIAEEQDAIQTFTMGCPLLKKINFEHMPSLFNGLVRSLVDNCPLLEELTMPLSRTDLIEIRKVRNLKRLEFTTVGDVSEADIAELFTLKGHSLEFIGFDFRNNSLLPCIADNCPSLKGIRFIDRTFCDNSEDYLYIYHKCKLLCYIDINCYSEYSIDYVPGEVWRGLAIRQKTLW